MILKGLKPRTLVTFIIVAEDLVFRCGRKPIARCIGPDMLMATSASALVRSKLLMSRGRWTPALLIRQSISGWSLVIVVMNLGIAGMLPVSRT